jgi:ABC-2 type transport system permease protein
MTAIFKRFFRDRWVSLLIYVIAGIGFLWMYVALFPFIKGQADQLNQMMTAYPESMKKAFGMQATFFSTLEGYISTEMFSFFWPMLVSFLGVATGALIVSGEIEIGTIELILSQPLERSKIYFAKYLTGVVNILIFVGISILAIVPLASIYNIDYHFTSYLKLTLMGFLFALSIFSIAALISAKFSDRGKVYFISAGVLILMYVLNIISALKDNLKNLQYFSLLHYFDAGEILINNKIDKVSILVFCLVIIICTLAGAIVFSKRDITT